MSEAFDPYLKWLAIPSDERPPNHYRLLGIPLFMADTEVISYAADQRMTHVKGFQTGEHAELSQRLLSEISASRACLLDVAKKAAYDAELKRRTAAPMPRPAPVWKKSPAPIVPIVPLVSSPPLVPAPPRSVAEEPAWPISDVDSSSGRSINKRGSALKPKRRRFNVGFIVLPAFALLIGTGFYLFRKELFPDQQPAKAINQNHALVVSAPVPPAPARNSVPEWPIVETHQPPVAPGTPASDQKPVLSDSQQSKKDSVKDRPGESGGLQPGILVEGSDHSGRRDKVPAPDESTQAKTLADIRSVLADDYATLGKLELARKLLKYGQDSEKTPARAYVLYREGGKAAVAAGDGPLIVELVDAMAAHYQGIDSTEMKIKALENAAKGVSKQDADQLATFILEFSQVPIEEEKFDTAEELAESALSLGRKSSDKEIIRRSMGRRKEIAALRKGYDEAAEAIAKLKQQPTDPEANTVAGKYYALSLGNWDKGRPMLAAGNDAALKVPAALDLATPTEADKQVAVGDAWWDFSLKATNPAKAHLQARAAYWYQQALPFMQDEFAKTKIQKRVEESSRAAEGIGAEKVAAKLGVTADRVVVWNTHNGKGGDRGTTAFNLSLRRKGVTVWEKKKVLLAWNAIQNPSAEIHLPRIPFDALRVEVTDFVTNGGGLSEIQVYSGTKNIAGGRPASASGTWALSASFNFSPLNVTDGVTQTAVIGQGYWLLPDKIPGWIEVDFSSTSLDK